MKYSVIVPIYVKDSFEHIVDKHIIQCLDSIITYTDFNDCEVILVINEYTDYALARLEPYVKNFDFKIILNKNGLGFAGAVNQGIRLSQGKYIILLNDDCILLPQQKNTWIARLVCPLEIDEKVGITGVTMLNCGHIQDDFLIGYCIMINRKVVNQIGYFDEIFNPGSGEDTDFCARAKKYGWSLVSVGQPDKVSDKYGYGSFPIFHEAEATFDHVPNTHERGERNANILKQRKMEGYYNKL